MARILRRGLLNNFFDSLKINCNHSGNIFSTSKTVVTTAKSSIKVKEHGILLLRNTRSSFVNLGVKSFRATAVAQQNVIQFKLADIGEGIKEVNVTEWFVKVGDTVNQFDEICQVQSDKASVTITSRFDGVIKKLYYDVDDTAEVGSPLVDIEIEGEPSKDADSGDSSQSDTTSDDSNGKSSTATHSKKGKVLATPAVRRIAMENDVSLSDVPASGKDGRVLKDDILAFLKGGADSRIDDIERKDKKPSEQQKKEKGTYRPVRLAANIPLGEDKTEIIKGIRKAMVKTMTEANEVPLFGYCDEIDMGQLVQLRKVSKKKFEDSNVKISYMPFIIKATSLALSEFPILNSSADEKCEKITYKAAHNIGIAMDTKDGLLVPIVKNVQSLSVYEIAEELNRLHALGLQNRLSPSDLSDGTFSLSNIGAIGGTYAKPVILPPQVAIGALGKIQKLPRFDADDNLVQAHIMCVSWSADHRIIEGATVARFSNIFKEYLENPAIMTFYMR